MRRRGFLAGGLALGWQARLAARAQNARPAALSGDSFMLDGAEYRLADILAPALTGLSAGADPYAEEARRMLTQLLSDGVLAVNEIGAPDRWERRIVNAHIASPENMSLQERLVAAGAARVVPESEDAPFINALLAVELAARAARRGLWALGVYRVRDARSAEDAIGAFHLVEGIVRQARAARGRVYLNFGDDYRSDFTASTTTRLAARWEKEGMALLALEGARLRIRGFVESINGPAIDLAHYQQVEQL